MKIKIRLGENDTNIQIPFTSHGNLLGYDDDVQSLVNDETTLSINSTSDGEVKRFLPDVEYNLTFLFSGSSGYAPELAPNDLTGSTTGTTIRNSFYIVQLFDDFKDETQSKKHTGYYNGFEIINSGITSVYKYNNSIEFSNFYLPQNVIDSLSGNTGATFYAKFLFYSAKSGKFYSFFNGDLVSSGTPVSQEELYQKVIVNSVTRKYSFENVSITMKELVNSAYTTLVNNTVNSFPAESPNYPSGTTFTRTGIYITS